MICQCEVCKYYLEFLDHLQNVPDEHKEFFRNMYSVFVETCMDRDYYEAIVKNEWPSSDEILALHRKPKLENVTSPVPEFKRNFEVGKTYLRGDGLPVKILEVRNENMKAYCMVKGNDVLDASDSIHGWRYDQSGCVAGGNYMGSSKNSCDLVIGSEVIKHVQV